MLSATHLTPVVAARTLQPQGLKPPLFVIPAAHGNPLPYADFARFLGSDQPVHVLQPVGFEGHRKPSERIETIAEHFIGEIRKVQTHGPYRLAGFCVGGIVAFEIAQQLIASGEEPPLLALIETWHPRSVPLERAAPALLRPSNFLVRGLRQASRRPAKPSCPRSVSLSPREQRHCQGNGCPSWTSTGATIIGVTEISLWRSPTARHPVTLRVPILGGSCSFCAGNLQVEADWDTRLVWCHLARDGCLVVRTSASDFGELLQKPHVRALADNLAERLREWPNTPGASSVYGLVS